MNARITTMSIAIGACLIASSVHAQPVLRSHTIDSGGGVITAGVYRLTGTIGQSDTSAPRSGGVYTLRGGFVVAPVCKADFNGVDGVTIQDIFDFLNAWFAVAPAADFNGLNGVSVQDIFDFLNAWFIGC